jgi:hypothetical protein
MLVLFDYRDALFHLFFAVLDSEGEVFELLVAMFDWEG